MEYFVDKNDQGKAQVFEVIRTPEDELGTYYPNRKRATKIANLINELERKFEGLEIEMPHRCLAFHERCGGVGHFVINTENAENWIHLDYYDRYENERMNDIMLKYDTYFEWYDAAVIVAFDA